MLTPAQEESSLDSVNAGVTLGDGTDIGCFLMGVSEVTFVVVRKSGGWTALFTDG